MYHLYGPTPTPYIDKELVDSLTLSLVPMVSARALVLWARHIFEDVVSWCPLFRSEFILESHVGSWTFVRCPETRSVHFSEVV